jgi:hypothetical protein
MSRLINFIDYLLTRGAASVEDQAAVEIQPNSIRPLGCAMAASLDPG